MPEDTRNIVQITEKLLDSGRDLLRTEITTGLRSMDLMTDFNVATITDSIDRSQKVIDDYNEAIRANIRASLTSATLSMNLSASLIDRTLQDINKLNTQLFSYVRDIIQEKIRKASQFLVYMTKVVGKFVIQGLERLSNIFASILSVFSFFGTRNIDKCKARFALYVPLIRDKITLITARLDRLILLLTKTCYMSLDHINKVLNIISTKINTTIAQSVVGISDSLARTETAFGRYDPWP